jgi:hypothetical protein
MSRSSVILLALYFWGFTIAPPMVWAIVEFTTSLKRHPADFPPPTLASSGVLTLKVAKGFAAFFVTLVGMLTTMGIIGSVDMISGLDGPNEGGIGWFYLVATIFCGVWILVPLRYQLVLEPDAIMLVGIFSSKRLLRGEIRGKQIRYGGGILYRLFPKDNNKAKIKIRFWYDDHGEIKKWLNDIPWVGKPPLGFGKWW